ncbi:hypothetical protein LC593_21865 [Nostoc sp. CHAB 5844]|nr:hypothetical protein [Nostoc sp. CHAB 5844]
MKDLSTILSLMLLIAVAGILNNVITLAPIVEIAHGQNVINHPHVYQVLFNLADFKLKDQSSLTGRLTVFDSKNKIITVSLSSSDSRSLPIYQIQQITFKQDIDGGIGTGTVMRGSKITLTGVPLDAFVLLDAKVGQATVDLTKMVNETKEDPIPPLEADEILYVEEMQFASPGKMTIKVKLTKRQIDSGEQ